MTETTLIQSPAVSIPASRNASASGPRQAEKLWFVEVKNIYKGNSTGREYQRYNNNFIDWHIKEYGKHVQITE